MYCIKCGKQVPDDSAFCAYCGEKQAAIPPPQPQGQYDVISQITAPQPIVKSKLAIASLVMGIASIILFVASVIVTFSTGQMMGDGSIRFSNTADLSLLGYSLVAAVVIAIVGIILAGVASSRAKRFGGPKKGSATSLVLPIIGCALSVAWLIYVAFVGYAISPPDPQISRPAPPPTDPASTSTDRAPYEDAIDTFFRSLNDGDIDALFRICTPPISGFSFPDIDKNRMEEELLGWMSEGYGESTVTFEIIESVQISSSHLEQINYALNFALLLINEFNLTSDFSIERLNELDLPDNHIVSDGYLVQATASVDGKAMGEINDIELLVLQTDDSWWIGILFWHYLLSDFFQASDGTLVTIPNFVNRAYAEIVEDEEHAEIFHFRPTYLHSDEIEEGMIVSQHPVAGREIAAPLPGSKINIELTVSLGPDNTALMPERPPIPPIPSANVRNSSKHTFLILGLEEGGLTDVIMTATFDTGNSTLDVASIPRDTLVNVSWGGAKKANSIYANMRARHGLGHEDLPAGMDATVDAFADVLGYEVDWWFLVDMRAFVGLVDAIGGVDFNVPVNIGDSYTRGMQHLNGSQALDVVMFRGYFDSDIGRIATQQSFLLSAAQQILEERYTINVPNLAEVFLRNVMTNIDMSSLIWFGTEFLKLDADDISFSIAPGNYRDFVGGNNYVTLYVDQWLELVNGSLNPFMEDIMPSDVSILTRGADGYLYTTDGNRQGDPSWGAASREEPHPPNADDGWQDSPPNDTPPSG